MVWAEGSTVTRVNGGDYGPMACEECVSVVAWQRVSLSRTHNVGGRMAWILISCWR